MSPRVTEPQNESAPGRYPAVFDVEKPARLEARHVFLRLAIVLLFLLLVAFVWLVSLIYVAVPVLVALLISRDGPEGYMRTSSKRLLRWIHWLVAFDAYITLLVDCLPGEKPPPEVRLRVTPSGSPTTGSALLRLVYSLPSALALAALGIAAVFTWVPAAVLIVARGDYPDALYGFHRGVVGWGARLLAYHASMVDRYPPFTLDGGRQPGNPTPSPVSREAAN